MEAVLTLTILSGGLMGILVLYEQNVLSANAMEQTAVATYLAQERVEQILQDKKYNLYASIVSANYPATEDMTASGFPGYTRTVSIVQVDATDLTTPQNNPPTGYKRLTVSVQIAGGNTVTLTTLLTEWGEL